MRGKRTRCWWCGKKLALPFYSTVIIDGHEHVVHKACREEIQLKPITAQPST